MGASSGWLIPLSEALAPGESKVGAKAVRLAQLGRAGFRVPRGFCLPVACYERFLHDNKLDLKIHLELGRKPLSSMRWEELWDTALRIRASFLAGEVPSAVSAAVRQVVDTLGPAQPLAVRSSAPGEDRGQMSFAGLHESVVGSTGMDAVLNAVRVVWASLWSDAALLYRTELGLDPLHSRMAVVIQEVFDERPSGVAFSRDPRGGAEPHAVIECVPGRCSDLVDGTVEPDRWLVELASGRVLQWHPSSERGDDTRLLKETDLARLCATLEKAESLLHCPADVEWTGRGEGLTLLQARPITTHPSQSDDPRPWYLSLRPAARRLRALAEHVSRQRIPELERLGERLASQDLLGLEDLDLAAAIEEQAGGVEHWNHIYWEEFIPLAHGVRQLGIYYNDAVCPEDPYEFVGLLKGQDMVAMQRNRLMLKLAATIREHPRLRQVLTAVQSDTEIQALTPALASFREGADFAAGLESVLGLYMDVAYAGERLAGRPDVLVSLLLEMADAEAPRLRPPAVEDAAARLERRLYDAVGPGRQREAAEIIDIGRLSWRLRDDDNVLVGRLESQLLRALRVGAERLRQTGRLRTELAPRLEDAKPIAEALRRPESEPVVLASPAPAISPATARSTAGRARQLVGQPASPGLASGRIRVVRSTDDLKRFRAGEVLACQAIEPTMTQLVPLACAIVERRGGMLIHGAIIAREMGIPCVNGIEDLLGRLADGDPVTVDGHLGIVTVGPPDFALEGVTLAQIGRLGVLAEEKDKGDV